MKSSNVAHLPTTEEAEAAKESSRALSQYANNDRLNLKIYSNGQETGDLILPGFAINMLLDVLTETAKGNAVTVIPIHAELSTQEAAELLNVSRPFLVGILEQSKIPHRKVGCHRRVMAKDVLEYKRHIDLERSKVLDELAVEAQKLGMGYE